MIKPEDPGYGILRTVTDAECVENGTIIVGDKDTRCILAEKRYSLEEYDRIVSESEEYSVYVERVLETTSVTPYGSEEFSECFREGIVVKDGKFAGLLLKCTVEVEVFQTVDKGSSSENYGIIFTDENSVGKVCDETRKSPGAWCFRERYFLKKR